MGHQEGERDRQMDRQRDRQMDRQRDRQRGGSRERGHCIKMSAEHFFPGAFVFLRVR